MREPENVDPTQIRNLWKVLKFDLLETQNSGFWPKKESKGFSTLLLLPHSFSTRPTSSFHSFHLSIHSSTSNIHFLPTIPLISHNTILAQTPSSLNSPIWRSKYPLRSSSKVPFMDFKLLVITFFNYFGMLLHFIVSNFWIYCTVKMIPSLIDFPQTPLWLEFRFWFIEIEFSNFECLDLACSCLIE